VIYIWDNGESYSEHYIAFVDGGDLPQADVLAFMALQGGDARVIGVAEQIQWLGDEVADDCESLGEWSGPLDGIRVYDTDIRQKLRERLAKIPASVLSAVKDAWTCYFTVQRGHGWTNNVPASLEELETIFEEHLASRAGGSR